MFLVFTSLFENRIIRFALYSTATVLFSELALHAYIYFREKIKELQQPTELNEVIIFNELTEGGNECSSMRNINRMAQQIDGAVYSIDVAIYTFTSLALTEAFKRALRRGVSIRIISDREMVHSSGSQISRLTSKCNIPVRGPLTTYMMHHKFCIIDSDARVEAIMRINKRRLSPRPYRSVVMSGSVNWTKQGFGGNWENCIITSNKQIVNEFQREFDRMWQKFSPLNIAHSN